MMNEQNQISFDALLPRAMASKAEDLGVKKVALPALEWGNWSSCTEFLQFVRIQRVAAVNNT